MKLIAVVFAIGWFIIACICMMKMAKAVESELLGDAIKFGVCALWNYMSALFCLLLAIMPPKQ